MTFSLQDAGGRLSSRAPVFVTQGLPDVGYQDEKGLRRHISVDTSPNEKGISARHENRDTAFKETLAELEVGSEVDVEPPEGKFHAARRHVAPARLRCRGASRITVFRSMFAVLPRSTFRIARHVDLFRNRDRESTAFLDELVELERELAGFRLT